MTWKLIKLVAAIDPLTSERFRCVFDTETELPVEPIQRFLNSCRQRGLAENTINTYAYRLLDFWRWLDIKILSWDAVGLAEMSDFATFSDDRQELADTRLAMEDFLETLRLKMHPIKSQLFETRHGSNFVGFRVLPDRIRVRNDNLRRSRRRLRGLQRKYAAGEIDLKSLVQRLQSWEAHLKHGDTHRLRREVFDYWVFVKGEELGENNQEN